jgi:tRNA(Ile)-lysidine synthase
MTPLKLPPAPFSRPARLIVGVSGGLDSVALLRLLLDQWPKAVSRLTVAHVNYGLRGNESRKDEEHVRHLCHAWGVPLKRLKLKGFKQRARRSRRSLQDLAREVRYIYFQECARTQKAWGVAVAHHQEDQAETVLDHLIRGAGPRGLSGLRSLQTLSLKPGRPPLKIWRPLLEFSKSGLLSYLQSRRISWREDSSNRASLYRRNQIRHEMVPFLSRWNPRLTETLARLGEVTAAEDELMQNVLKSVEREVKSRWKKTGYDCLGERFVKTPLALKRRWVRLVAEKLAPPARGLSFDRVEEIVRLWEGREKGPRDLGYGLIAGKNQNRAYLSRVEKSRKRVV